MPNNYVYMWKGMEGRGALQEKRVEEGRTQRRCEHVLSLGLQEHRVFFWEFGGVEVKVKLTE